MVSHTWFLCKIKFEKECEDGKSRKVSELYLMDALSFTEAEARIIGEVTPFISGDFVVSAIKRENISEVFNSENIEDEKWYKIKCAFIIIDGNSGAEKRQNNIMLINSSSTKNAEKSFHERMKGTMADYKVVEVKETEIVDVCFYSSEKETEETK